MLEMTDHQRAVLAHIVVDPDAWFENAVKALGEDKAAAALRDKVARWEDDYARSLSDRGDDYKPRALRNADEGQ